MTTRVTEGARCYFYQFSEILSRLDVPAVLPVVCRNALVSENNICRGLVSLYYNYFTSDCSIIMISTN